jgi:mannose-6-phosphate isomerase-like protein (cupin superfamily)
MRDALGNDPVEGVPPEGEGAAPNRKLHLARPDFRITEVSLTSGEAVGWHRHTAVDDTFYVVEGRVHVSMRDPEEIVTLDRGQSWGAVAHGRPHNVSNPGASPAVVLVLQGFGSYDFLPLD